MKGDSECLKLSWIQRSLVLIVGMRRRNGCLRTPASFSMIARGVGSFLSPNQAIAACFAPMERFPVHRFSRIVRVASLQIQLDGITRRLALGLMGFGLSVDISDFMGAMEIRLASRFKRSPMLMSPCSAARA